MGVGWEKDEGVEIWDWEGLGNNYLEKGRGKENPRAGEKGQQREAMGEMPPLLGVVQPGHTLPWLAG